MRISLVARVPGLIVAALTGLLAGACAAENDIHDLRSLPPPYAGLPSPPPGASIERGIAVVLDARQQESVIAGVTKVLKAPVAAQFGAMEGIRNSRGIVTVCGEVNARNGDRAYAGMAPYIGVLMGVSAQPDFVVVGIGASPRERAEVASLCREAGAVRRR